MVESVTLFGIYANCNHWQWSYLTSELVTRMTLIFTPFITISKQQQQRARNCNVSIAFHQFKRKVIANDTKAQALYRQIDDINNFIWKFEKEKRKWKKLFQWKFAGACNENVMKTFFFWMAQMIWMRKRERDEHQWENLPQKMESEGRGECEAENTVQIEKCWRFNMIVAK